MLSPATFIGIANATAPTGQPAPAPAAGRTGNIQPVRVLSTPPVVSPIAQPLARPGVTASPNATAAPPPRNLPRGSLLDLSV
jgi:hypothetical protein